MDFGGSEDDADRVILFVRHIVAIARLIINRLGVLVVGGFGGWRVWGRK